MPSPRSGLLQIQSAESVCRLRLTICRAPVSAYFENDPSTATAAGTVDPKGPKPAVIAVLVIPNTLTNLPLPPLNWNAPLPLNASSVALAKVESHSIPLNPTLIVAPFGNVCTPIPEPGRHNPLGVPLVTDWLRSKFRSIVSVDFPSTVDLSGMVTVQQWQTSASAQVRATSPTAVAQSSPRKTVPVPTPRS